MVCIYFYSRNDNHKIVQCWRTSNLLTLKIQSKTPGKDVMYNYLHSSLLAIHAVVYMYLWFCNKKWLRVFLLLLYWMPARKSQGHHQNWIWKVTHRLRVESNVFYKNTILTILTNSIQNPAYQPLGICTSHWQLDFENNLHVGPHLLSLTKFTLD